MSGRVYPSGLLTNLIETAAEADFDGLHLVLCSDFVLGLYFRASSFALYLVM